MMATRETGRGRAPPTLGASLAALRGALPVVVLLLDVAPSALAGCGPYGYDCTDPVCLAVEVTRDQGSTWETGSATVSGAPDS